MIYDQASLNFPPTLSEWPFITLEIQNISPAWFSISANVTSATFCGDVPPEEPPPPVTATICHKAGKKSVKTLVVLETDVAGHLKHGDTLGACQ